MMFINKEFFIGTVLGILGVAVYNFIKNNKEILEDMEECTSNYNNHSLKSTEESVIEDKITDYIEQINTQIDTLGEKLDKLED